VTLTLIARLVPPLFAVALSVYATWCQAIAFVGGTIPLVGWRLEGGFLTGLLWALGVSGFISWGARLALRLLLAAIGVVVPLTVAAAPRPDRPDGPSRDDEAGGLPRAPEGVADGYVPGFASLCAVASQLVYQPDEQVKNAVGPLQAAGLSLIVEQNHRCLLLAYADCIIVAFRGTDAGELADWKTNLNHSPTAVAFGLVHSGYLAAVELMWPRLTASLARMREGEQSLLLTGHSMGGALAVVAAAKFASEGSIPIAGLYTFGQPALADPAFEAELARRVDSRYFRFVNSIDMVPGLAVDPAFRHGGQQLFIDRGGRIHTRDLLTAMVSARLLTSVLEPETRRAEVDDHGIAEYVRALTTAPSASLSAGLGRLSTRERVHLWASAATYAAVFVILCVLAWRWHGAASFAMATNAAFVLMLVGAMLAWPLQYNDHLLHWYVRQGLAKNPVV
jgi:triacylglycerol lipase